MLNQKGKAYQCIILMLSIHCNLQSQITWKPVIVSKATMQNMSITTTQVSTTNDIECSIYASRQPWALIFCIMDWACTISDFFAAPYPSPTPITDPVECMTNTDGCLMSGKIFPIGQYYCPPSGPLGSILYKCIEGVMVPQQRPPPRSSCPDPFLTTYVGCILKGNDSRGWCEARKYCHSLGSDLLMFDQLTSRAQLKPFIDSYNLNTYMQFGMTGNATNWQFLNGKQLFSNSTMWHSIRNPFGTITSSDCGFIFSNDDYASYGFSAATCAGTGSYSCRFFCQIDLIN